MAETSSTSRSAIIIGVGPRDGLGARLGQRFGREGLHVFLSGRTEARVAEVAAGLREQGHQATAVAADATSEAGTIALFDRAEAVAPVDLVIYNAGNNMPGDFRKMEVDYFERCWRVACLGGFVAGREAARRMAPRGRGTVLFTGASASMRGRPNFAAFASAKAGLRAVAQSMAREFGPQGLHVAHVVIDGGIFGEKIRTAFADRIQSLGEERFIDLDGIAETYAALYAQGPRAWSHEVDLRTAAEPF
ncbi:MAG TPA: SDR family NAD(P)-dependent oxidoreductase [Caulobacteraceae bacterium]|jgi:NAD(P)-dependent dehydrogenase (short-subunit alcohol dehydrogenase family)|nr:SDR family NAD(P)-dependent oxidoreductase [Caulobacteraceae bacterium]